MSSIIFRPDISKIVGIVEHINRFINEAVVTLVYDKQSMTKSIEVSCFIKRNRGKIS